jgi:hypothetical protein
MSTEDLRIWFRFQDQLPEDTHTLYFNVRLGEGKPSGQDDDTEWQTYWHQVTSKRADVVLVRPGELRIIELRNHASANAIGRLLMYRTLWTDDPQAPGKVTAQLVTNVDDPDVRRQAAASDITYTVV